MIDLGKMTIESAHESLKKGEFSVHELVDAYLKNIDTKNNELNAYLEVYGDIDDQIKKAQEKFKDGTATLLTGIPFAIKDNILIEGQIASAGSKILGNYRASYDATVIKILKSEGVIFLGRTNMDEFAMGSSTQTSAYGIARNPIDPTRVPGGSSGGSAASVAGDMALVALGTETCGSVREPSAFCSLVGMKPTYGALSRHGIIAMGNSLDQVSPFGKTVRDTEIIFEALSHYDKNDATSIKENLRDKLRQERSTEGSGMKKIGIPWHLFSEGVDPEVIQNFKDSVEKFKKAGYEIVDIEMPYSKYSLAVYYIVMPAEVSTNLSRFDGVRYGYSAQGEGVSDSYKKTRSDGFGREARRRIILGNYVLSQGLKGAHTKALKVRDAISQEMRDTFARVDFVMTPTVPFLPFKIGEKMDDPVAMYLSDLFSAPANITGTPSIALPSGFSKEGLPFSIQFVAPHFREGDLFEIGKKFEIIR
jgi:aspartyl-tRNA(Asn)/glutamyl-tRNA(Gln) amidotransferase subunit A